MRGGKKKGGMGGGGREGERDCHSRMTGWRRGDQGWRSLARCETCLIKPKPVVCKRAGRAFPLCALGRGVCSFV